MITQPGTSLLHMTNHMTNHMTSQTTSSEARPVTVEFTVPSWVGAVFVDVVGEFLAWSPLAMRRCEDGRFVATLRLDPGRTWRYRFLIDGERWINDWEADDYVLDDDGSCMSLLRT